MVTLIDHYPRESYVFTVLTGLEDMFSPSKVLAVEIASYSAGERETRHEQRG